MPTGKVPAGDDLSVFAGVRDWIFDLDDTLYPPESGVFTAVMGRIRAYTARATGLTAADAAALQKEYAARYGTTLRGLMEEHGVDPADFLADVHAIDRSALVPDARLAEALLRLPGRKFILTSGTHAHVGETLACLAIADRFDGVFDIADADYLPKPAEATYAAFLDRFAIKPVTAAMFEDAPRNLVVPRALGMRTVLVTGRQAPPPASPDADFITADLSGFLSRIIDALSG
ncbi:pyrimidine 5'-nucleotidase [Pleomorphomonas diazotrophica]|uniref:Pyrimidine 5'-nucleotidase n=1 Tax=Pleomorphomonas diazotrophica TaxID=1166257 RepID=A0A1I4TCH0_9HYPH|nr:pyrimidine 5'-nucleotidase [Pleomorphomonas diazotrophica]PKR89424.1 pyrimidine 5'-nucleotidase [Pleomorphomonas diazotrophica]SFM74313.1 putative hydrolase of the HAD superfamily [Pleomorphomonas diazotrophica]